MEPLAWYRGTVTASFLPEGTVLPCWTNGQLWNGHGQPYFERAEVDKLFGLVDTLRVGTDDLVIEPINEPWQVFAPDMIFAEQAPDGVKVWGIGVGCWTWDPVKETRPALTLDELVERMKDDVGVLIERGFVPATVRSLEELDTHVDINTLGNVTTDVTFDTLKEQFGAGLDDDMPIKVQEFVQQAHDQINDWLGAGGHVPEDKPRLYALTQAEHATVLAALRYYQCDLDTMRTAGVYDIATNMGAITPLTADDIDGLCEGLNHGGLEIGEVVNILGSDDNPIVAAARNHRLLEEGTLEVEETTIVNMVSETSAYVMAWLHIDLEEK